MSGEAPGIMFCSGEGAGALLPPLPPLLMQLLPPVKHASRKMTNTSSSTTPTTIICMRKFCHHMRLRSCVPCRWNLAACEGVPFGGSSSSTPGRQTTGYVDMCGAKHSLAQDTAPTHQICRHGQCAYIDQAMPCWCCHSAAHSPQAVSAHACSTTDTPALASVTLQTANTAALLLCPRRACLRHP